MSPKSVDRIWIGGAFVLHVALVFAILPWALALNGHYWAQNFPDGYDLIAQNLVNGNGYRYFPDTAATLQRTPAYPLVLAAIFLFFGHSLAAAQAVNLLFDLGTALCTYALARRLTEYRTAALAAAAIVLFHPAVLLSASRGGVESMLIFSTALFLLTFVRALETHRVQSYVAAGVALGFSCLVKPLALLFAVLYLGCIVVARRRTPDTRVTVVGTCVMMAVMALMMAPWALRNYVVTERFVPTMTILGISMDQNRFICRETNVLQGKVRQIEDSVIRYDKLAREQGREFRTVADCCGPFFYSARDEVEFNDYLKKSAVDDYMRHPAFFLGCTAENAVGFWIAGRDRTAVIMNMLVQLPLLLLALLGMLQTHAHGNRRVLWALLAYIFYVVAVHVPVLAFARHSVQLIAPLSAFAGVALAAMLTRGRTRPRSA